MDVKYPDCTVELMGVDGNSVAIFMKVARELKKYLTNEKGWSPQDAEREAEEFKCEATSGDYDNVLITCHRWVNVT
ncbi:hypothetical protein [Streptomyces cucumeris]|uniref:hypothetical protein n=1 Tax=Streptomyces cucumeris TaxID=2962890 RepID=UPI0020C87EC2|nr:hypothetical protein [Streptomyces sp. NEAU-Y11]MCP9209572.1 hypothetical protein [Streptomyces sp. NEAU-Y11]